MDKKTEENILKCSRCGLCADVCPVYKAKRTEKTLLRGKFLQLLGLIRGELKWSNRLKSSLDECLGCDKCKIQCPSGLSAPEIFEKIKFENLNGFEKFLYGKFVLKIKIFALRIFYRVKHPVKSIVSGKKHDVIKIDKNLVHFNGCLSKCINTEFALPFALNKGKFECCGIPYKTKGNLDEYKAAASKNVQKIEKTDGLVVFNCATCLSAVRSYEFNLPESKERLVFYTELYKEFLKTHKITSKKPVTVTFHHPCHLKSAGIELFDVEEILNSIENVNYAKLQNPDECCGFGGDYFTRHPRTADFLSTKKIEDVINSGAQIVLTACPTCLWSLKYGIKKLHIRNIKAYDLAEFLYSLDFTEKKLIERETQKRGEECKL